MKRILPVFIALLTGIYVQGQNADTSLSLDILHVPQSPGFTILGVNPSEVDRPTDLVDVAVSTMNATNSGSGFPRNYALEFAPAWLMNKKGISSQDFLEKKSDPWQNLSISIATATYKNDGSDMESSKLGVGVKTTLLRGDRISSKFKAQVNKLENILLNYHHAMNESFEEDSNSEKYRQARLVIQLEIRSVTTNMNKEKVIRDTTTIAFIRDSLTSKITTDSLHKSQLIFARDIIGGKISSQNDILEKRLNESTYKDSIEMIKRIVSEIEVKRYGFKLEMATAFALDFPTQKFDFSKLKKWSYWLTASYEHEIGVSGLAMARLSVIPSELYLDKNNTTQAKNNVYGDIGMRLILDRIRHLTISGELIWHIPINNTALKVTNRYMLNISYEVIKNKVLSFNIGKDFDGNIQKSGNLLAAINLVLGFGSSRPITKATTN